MINIKITKKKQKRLTLELRSIFEKNNINSKIEFLNKKILDANFWQDKTKSKNIIKEKKINKERKITVILTTHDMNDIESLADRILLIGKGKILYDGNIDDLRNKFLDSKIITIDYKENDQQKQFKAHFSLKR